jgi:hypothetical protein
VAVPGVYIARIAGLGLVQRRPRRGVARAARHPARELAGNERASSGRPSREHTQIAFEVDDLTHTASELRARGAVFEEYDAPGRQTSDGIASVSSASMTASLIASG